MLTASGPPEARLAGQRQNGVKIMRGSPKLHGATIVDRLHIGRLLRQFIAEAYRPPKGGKHQHEIRFILSCFLIGFCHRFSPHRLFAQLEQIEICQVLLNIIKLYNKKT